MRYIIVMALLISHLFSAQELEKEIPVVDKFFGVKPFD